MSSEAIQPEVAAADVQASQSSLGDLLSAANREAEAEFNTDEAQTELQAEESEDADAVDEPSAEDVEEAEVDPDEDAEDQAAEDGDESEDDSEKPPVGMDWDGDPETVPPELKPGFDRAMKLMNKGMNQKFRELAAEREQVQQLAMQYQQAMLKIQEQGKPKTAASSNQRPKPPGEGATAAEWQDYEDAVIDHRLAQKGGNELPNEAQQRLAVLEEKQQLDARLGVITSQPGASDEIMAKMQSMAAEDPEYMKMYYTSDATAIQFFKEAKLAVREDALALKEAEIATKSAATAAATAKRKVGAVKRSSGRPGSVTAAKGSSAVNKFSSKAFTPDERIAAINKDSLSDTGT